MKNNTEPKRLIFIFIVFIPFIFPLNIKAYEWPAKNLIVQKHCRDSFFWKEDFVAPNVACMISCTSSQSVSLQFTDCPPQWFKLCEEGCAKQKEQESQAKHKKSIEINVEKRDCEKLSNPGFWKKLWDIPKSPVAAIEAYILARDSIKVSRELYPDVERDGKRCNLLHNGPGDAFRHCYWSCSMSKIIEPQTAKRYSSYYESQFRNECNEALMDNHNNQVGISLGTRGANCLSDCKDSEFLNVISEDGECK